MDERSLATISAFGNALNIHFFVSLTHSIFIICKMRPGFYYSSRTEAVEQAVKRSSQSYDQEVSILRGKTTNYLAN